MKNNIIVRCGQALLTFGALAISLNAHAAPVVFGPCTVNNVFRDVSGTRISCVENRLQVYTRSSCNGISYGAETLRSWESMAEAALLSGKHLSFAYDNAGVPCVYSVEIW